MVDFQIRHPRLVEQPGSHLCPSTAEELCPGPGSLAGLVAQRHRPLPNSRRLCSQPALSPVVDSPETVTTPSTKLSLAVLASLENGGWNDCACTSSSVRRPERLQPPASSLVTSSHWSMLEAPGSAT